MASTGQAGQMGAMQQLHNRPQASQLDRDYQARQRSQQQYQQRRSAAPRGSYQRSGGGYRGMGGGSRGGMGRGGARRR